MKKVNQIKIWKSDKGETRIYITFEGEKEQGCYYKDGNNYQAKGRLKNMTEEDKKNAIALCEKVTGKRTWINLYANQIENLNKFGKITAPVQKENNQYNSYSRFDRQMSEYERDKAKGFPVHLDDYMD